MQAADWILNLTIFIIKHNQQTFNHQIQDERSGDILAAPPVAAALVLWRATISERVNERKKTTPSPEDEAQIIF